MKKITQDGVFDLAEIDGVTVLFSPLRLDRDTVPDGLYCYDIRSDDDRAGTPVTLEKAVLVNHYGTILSANVFPLGNGYYEIKEEGINFLSDVSTVANYLMIAG